VANISRAKEVSQGIANCCRMLRLRLTERMQNRKMLKEKPTSKQKKREQHQRSDKKL